MKRSFIRTVVDRCRKDLKNHPEYARYPHWSFLVCDNRIYATGLNRTHEPLIIYGYHRKHDHTFRPKLHAELEAFRKFHGNLLQLHVMEMLNIRLNRRGELRCARPCTPCLNMLVGFEIKTVYWSTLDQDFTKLKLRK